MRAFYFNLGLAILNGFYQWLSAISFCSSFDNQCVLIFSSFNLNLSHYPVAIVYFKCGSNSIADELLLKFSLNLEVTEAGSQVTLSVFNYLTDKKCRCCRQLTAFSFYPSFFSVLFNVIPNGWTTTALQPSLYLVGPKLTFFW